MAISYLKKATQTAEAGQTDVRAAVERMLAEIEAGGDDAVRRFARELDTWEGEIVVSPATIRAAATRVPDKLKADIRFAHVNIRRFAEAQRWFHYLFDPTDDGDGPTPERFWKVQPFQYTDEHRARLEEIARGGRACDAPSNRARSARRLRRVEHVDAVVRVIRNDRVQ